jgi:hypothetical protein
MHTTARRSKSRDALAGIKLAEKLSARKGRKHTTRMETPTTTRGVI